MTGDPDLIDAFESLPAPQRDSTDYPDYSFHLASSVIRIDHRHAATTLSILAPERDEVAARRRLAAEKPDIVCLQEIKCVDENFPREAFEALAGEAGATSSGDSLLARIAVGVVRTVDDGDAVVFSGSASLRCSDFGIRRPGRLLSDTFHLRIMGIAYREDR